MSWIAIRAWTRRGLKCCLLALAKGLGLFELTKLAFRNRLLILAYHGFENHDESAFRPRLFMRQSTFEKRMRTIRKAGLSVLPLNEAVERMRSGTLAANSVAITIDDGFRGVFTQAAPVLARHGLPATLYATTYYMEKGEPIPRLAIQCMFWQTRRKTVELGGDSFGDLAGEFDLTDPEVASRLCWRIIAHIEAHDGEERRQALAAEVGEILGVDYGAIASSDMFRLMSPHELRHLHSSDMDIQLHTHRHTLAREGQGCVAEEIKANAARLEQWLGKRCVHFCYPGGE